MRSGFGTKAIAAIVHAYEWSESWDVAPSAALVFFAALPLVFSNTPASVPNEDALRAALAELDSAEGGNPSWQVFLDELARHAAGSVVTVNDVVRSAWKREERPIRDVFKALRLPVLTIGPLLSGALDLALLDEPPPVIENGPPRYEVVIKGEDGDDASNRYATFEDARYVLARLSAKFFGGERPAQHTGNPVMYIMHGGIGKPRSASIREVLG